MRILIALVLLFNINALHAKTAVQDAPVVRVLFTPQDNVQNEIVKALRRAQKQVWVQAYILTDNVVSDALIAAHKRGVRVHVLMDAERARESRGSDAQRLTAAGIAVRLETRYENAHNKLMLIDGQTIITGSYNFTYAAQYKNAENMLFINNAPQLFKRYLDNWQAHNLGATDFK